MSASYTPHDFAIRERFAHGDKCCVIHTCFEPPTAPDSLNPDAEWCATVAGVSRDRWRGVCHCWHGRCHRRPCGQGVSCPFLDVSTEIFRASNFFWYENGVRHRQAAHDDIQHYRTQNDPNGFVITSLPIALINDQNSKVIFAFELIKIDPNAITILIKTDLTRSGRGGRGGNGR